MGREGGWRGNYGREEEEGGTKHVEGGRIEGELCMEKKTREKLRTAREGGWRGNYGVEVEGGTKNGEGGMKEGQLWKRGEGKEVYVSH